jgi:carbohydrate diacid regulator
MAQWNGQKEGRSLTLAISHLERIEDRAASIAQRLAQLLHARVWVTDTRHMVIASSEPKDIGRNFAIRPVSRLQAASAVTVAAPASLRHMSAAEITLEQLDGERIPPHFAQAIVDLGVREFAQQTAAPDARELKNHFVYNLLFETSLNEDALTREGYVLGIDLTIPRAAILIDAKNYILAPGAAGQSELDEAQMRQRANHVIASIVNFFHLPTDTICAYVGDGEIVVLKASSSRDLIAWADHQDQTGDDEAAPSWAGLPALKRAGAALLTRVCRDTGADICLGVGRYHPGVRGLKLSYQDARAALSLGRHFHGENQIYCLDSLGIAAFIGIGDERTKVDLARRLLGPLDHEPELIDTVQTFFAMDCSPSATAAQLGIHRNTLNYRLEKIFSLTGLDPRKFDDAVQIRIALLARSLRN